MTLSPSPPFPWGRGQLGQGWLEAARPHPVLSSRTRSFLQVKLWRLPAPDGLLPSGPGLVLGPEDVQVEVLQFHPTADGILVSAAGRTVKVWDAAKQQPLTGMGHTHCPSLGSPVWQHFVSLFMILVT